VGPGESRRKFARPLAKFDGATLRAGLHLPP
jgi:hypothetical protein